MTTKDLLEDLLIEYDELGMEPTTVVPNPSERAMVWKRELTCALRHLRAEVAREIFEEIEEYAELQIESLNIVEKVYLSGAAFFGGGKQAFVLLLDRLAELKKKYTQSEPPKGAFDERRKAD